MIEIDAVIFILTGVDQQSLGFNFLQLINLNFNYFASDHMRNGTGYAAPLAVTGLVSQAYQWGWIFAAVASYSVNIANASQERVAVLARPHLTALSGTPAKFLAGGELVYQVSGNISGDIKPYPFGTTLMVTPTLLRTPAEDGTPRVHMVVEAGRTSVLSLLDLKPNQPTNFTKVTVASEAVLSLDQTLILSGLSQRESRTGRSGVPILMDIPILKYLFSTTTTIHADSAVIILLTPRDPAFRDERNEKALAEFVEKRRAFLQARQGTEEDMRRFRERHPDWDQIPPNRFASHFYLLQNSELYRAASGQDLISEDLDLELLGPKSNKKRTPKKTP
jgi:type II secretory pathway component GspD/PulD (secretin)